MRFRGRQPHFRKKFASTSKSTLMTSAALMKATVAHIVRVLSVRGTMLHPPKHEAQ